MAKVTIAEQSHLQIRPATAPVKECGCPDYRALEQRFSRRSFLKRVGAAGVVAGIATPTMSMQYAFGSAPYAGDVLVVLSLRGGFDGLNAIVPTGDPHYLDWRPNIGIPQSALLQLDPMFGMHPALSPLKPYFDDGSLGIVHAVGMAEPNRSHFQAMEEMERAAPGTSLRTGWIDRVIGMRDVGTPFQGIQMGSSLAASSFLGPNPELAMWSVDSFGHDAAWDATERARWDTALHSLHAGAADTVGPPADLALEALATTAALADAGYTPAHGAVYPADSDLGSALKDTARLIKAGVGLQVASIDYGDWDMHSGMGTTDDGWMHDHLTELETR